jgi:hypothetical protein
MLRHNWSRSPGLRLLTILAAAWLAACAGRTAVIPSQSVPVAPDALLGTGMDSIHRDAAPPKCKSQKNTKQYASVASQKMNTKGSSLCVPSFGGWGGALQFPSTDMNYTVGLISSTKAYDPSLFPPAGSQKAVFYLQYKFSGFPQFGSALPAGKPLVSSHLAPNKPYTVEASENVYVGWTPLGSCYSVAKKSLYGGEIAHAGAVLEGQFFRERSGVIEVFKGKLVSNAC